MTANLCVPLFEPGHRITVKTTGAVTGKRFVKVSATMSDSGPALSTTTGGGNIKVAQSAAGDGAFGIAEADIASGAIGQAICGPGFIVPVTAGAAITAGDEVKVGTGGKAVTASGSDRAVGRAVTTAAADGDDVYIQFYGAGTLIDLPTGDNYASGTPQATVADVAAPDAAITGGESPTEAEFNSLRAVVASLVTAVNAHSATLEEYGMQLTS